MPTPPSLPERTTPDAEGRGKTTGHAMDVPRVEVSPARLEVPTSPQRTHFAYWSCGVLLQTTPEQYAEEVRKIERLIGPPWLKGVNRMHGRYEPIP